MMQERLNDFLLRPHTWMTRANGNIFVARYYLQQISPAWEFKASDYTDSFTGRLLLLSQAEWELLGFAVAISPMMGTINQSINGKFKKAIKGRFDETTLTQFDAVPTAFSTEKTISLLQHNCWANPETVALSGIQSIKALPNFTIPQQKILDLRFPETAPAVSHLTILLVEELCKISLPKLSWLFNGMPSKSQQDELNSMPTNTLN